MSARTARCFSLVRRRRCANAAFLYGIAGIGLLTSNTASSTDPATVFVYDIADLGDLPGGVDVSAGSAIAIGSSIVGVSDGAEGRRAVRWSAQDGLTSLGALPGMKSEATNANDIGQVVGVNVPGSNVRRAFLWTQEAGMRSIPLNSALDINSSGVVAGYVGIVPNYSAAIWSEEGGRQNIGPLLGKPASIAYSIDDGRQVVGVFGEVGLATGHAFLWHAETEEGEDLGDLPGGADNSRALDINSRGEIVGYSDASTGRRAFMWTVSEGMVDLGDLPGGANSSSAYAISSPALDEVGKVVGESGSGTNKRAFLWQAGTMYDLNDLVDAFDPLTPYVRLNTARGINMEGRIVADGVDSRTGVKHAYLLTPIRNVTVRPAVIESGGTVTVLWEGISAPSAADWFGLYTPGAANANSILRVYLSCSDEPLGDSQCLLDIPATLPLGTYEVRLFANDGFKRLGRSNPFTVTAAH